MKPVEDVVQNSDLPLVLTRTFDAPPQRVFGAWLDPAQIEKWIGPRGVRGETQLLEPRVGGRYRIQMRTPDGSDPVVSGVYREIVPPSRLVFTWTWEHERHEMLISVTFRAAGRETEMTLRQENFASAERRDSHGHGWTGSFDKLAEMYSNRES